MGRPRRVAHYESPSLENMGGHHDLDPICEAAIQRAYHEMLAKGASPLEAHGVALRIYRYHMAGRSPDAQKSER